MKIPYRDLSVKDPELKAELLQSVDSVLSHGRTILGPEVDEFEKQIAEYCQKKYAVGVNSGTDALYYALRCLDVGQGDEVINTSFMDCHFKCNITMRRNPCFCRYLR